ncbi:MAG: hypothetical protein JOZ46_05395 [Candidatus Dormibacteraeota bacterium]|nr:hypothetical protein [Candidatus Dormibacteraeota bacterium]
MGTKVVCPVCWTWADLGSRTTCRRCRTPLVLADGRRVDEVAALTGVAPGSPIADGAYAAAAPQWVRERAPAAPAAGGTVDWVGLARWITIGYGILLVAAMLVVGVVFRHITVTLLDPHTGQLTATTLNLGPAFTIAALVVGAVMALCAWLTQYAAARVLFLLADVLGIFASLTNLSSVIQPGPAGIAGVLSLLVDVLYGGVLAMSLVARSRGRS